VQASLATLMKGRTTVVVAHRLSTVVDADVIYVIEGGRVAESGTHGDLLTRGGIYARLHALQSSERPVAG
jgi:subfamily B ATP-binding cassette protein MsbA